jgi:nitrogen fixation/metabolism regulation signal transduction histidine kinase
MLPVPHDERADFLRAVLDAIPSPVLIVDDDIRILDFNLAAAQLLGEAGSIVLKRRGGEALHCIHSAETPGGCGSAPACGDCAIRNSVREAYDGKRVCRKAHLLEIAAGGRNIDVNMLVTTAPIQYKAERLVLLVLEDVSELVSLRRIVPMCAGCRKIRDDQEYWQQVELYFKRHLDIDVSHGICPECAARLYPEYSGQQPPGPHEP